MNGIGEENDNEPEWKKRRMPIDGQRNRKKRTTSENGVNEDKRN